MENLPINSFQQRIFHLKTVNSYKWNLYNYSFGPLQLPAENPTESNPAIETEELGSTGDRRHLRRTTGSNAEINIYLRQSPNRPDNNKTLHVICSFYGPGSSLSSLYALFCLILIITLGYGWSINPYLIDEETQIG